MGGPSTEREISLLSGKAVVAGLRLGGYDVVEIDPRDRKVVIPEGVEVVFNALHGEFGEDGQVQEQLNQLGVPYTGPGVVANKLCFDKKLTAECLHAAGLPMAPGEFLMTGDKRTLDLPVVVKPIRQGSSLGLHRVLTEEEWDGAFHSSLAYDGEVLVEKLIKGREITVGLLDGMPLPIVEICAPGGDYSFDNKYKTGLTSYVVPADLPAEVSARAKEIAVKAFAALGCKGMSRLDMLLDENNELYILENNTIPGFTATSLLPKAAASAGIPFTVLCSQLLEIASCD